jgi:hypothetical protein
MASQKSFPKKNRIIPYFCIKLISFENQTFSNHAAFYPTEYAVSGNRIYQGVSEYQKYRVCSSGFGNRSDFEIVFERRFAKFV